MDRIKVDDLKLRPEVFAVRLERRAKLRDAINAGMPDDRQGRRRVQPRRVLRPGAEPDRLAAGPATPSTSTHETDKIRDRYGRNTFGQSCLLARRLVEAGTRVVEVIWPKVANSDNHSWDHHVGLTEPDEEPVRPDARRGPLRPASTDLDQRGLLDETLVVAVGEFGRSPQKGVSTSRQRQQRRRPRPLAVLLHRRHRRRRHQARLRPRQVRQDRLRPRSRTRSIPSELLATIYHAFGIDPDTIVYNHLNQPRELVKAEAVTRLFALRSSRPRSVGAHDSRRRVGSGTGHALSSLTPRSLEPRIRDRNNPHASHPPEHGRRRSVSARAALGAQEPAKQELARHQGTWTAVSFRREGQETPAEIVRTITRTVEGDHVVWKRDGKSFAGTTVVLDPGRDPKAIDVLPDGGPSRGKRVLGIYKIEKDTLTLCMADPDQPRPREFKAEKGSKHTLMVFRRRAAAPGREDAPRRLASRCSNQATQLMASPRRNPLLVRKPLDRVAEHRPRHLGGSAGRGMLERSA